MIVQLENGTLCHCSAAYNPLIPSAVRCDVKPLWNAFGGQFPEDPEGEPTAITLHGAPVDFSTWNLRDFTGVWRGDLRAICATAGRQATVNGEVVEISPLPK
jgi:hypothetical protein